ncbi:MAG: HDOD domain-containing protein [Opitutae bacterium]|nr:HDOD domain-containing protein [Opitutae bacterium]
MPAAPAPPRAAELPAGARPADPEAVRAALAETLMRPVADRGAVAFAVPVDEAARRASTEKALAELRQIPALQSLARGFMLAAGRDGVSIDEVVAAIGKDPSLCVRLLKMANSAFVKPVNRIDDLPSAVQMLGVLRVRSLVQTLYTLRDSRAIAPGFDWRHLWLHALATAALSEELERQLGIVSGPLLYLAALLHDVGKIVLSVIAPEDYSQILLAAWQDSRPLEELERARFGLTHREAGEIYLRQNNLADAVLATVAHHHAPGGAPEGNRLIVAVVAVANYLSKAYGLGFSGAVLTAADGEFADLPAWRVIEAETRRAPDIAFIEERLRACIPGIKAQLMKLREGAV